MTDKKARAADVAKLVSQAWKDLSDEQRQVWVDKGRQDRLRYEKEKATYRGPWKIPVVKHPNAPKKPMSAFLAFSNERRAIIAESNPGLTGTEISTLLSKLWKNCPASLKKVYRDREMEERIAFKKKLADWETQNDKQLVMEYFSGNSSDETSGCTSELPSTSPGTSIIPNIIINNGTSFATSNGNNSGGEVQRIPTEISMPSLWNSLANEPEPDLDYLANAVWTSDPVTLQAPEPAMVESFTPIHRYENYSLEDLLEDEELFFEDFAPSQVVPIVSRTRS